MFMLKMWFLILLLRGFKSFWLLWNWIGDQKFGLIPLDTELFPNRNRVLQFGNLTNFSKVHLMEAAPLTFLYLSNELVSTFICNSYKYISELQQLHLESRKYSLQLKDKCIWHGGAIWHSCIFQMSCRRHSFAFHSMQSRQSSAHKNSDDHKKTIFVVNCVIFLCCVASIVYFPHFSWTSVFVCIFLYETAELLMWKWYN